MIWNDKRFDGHIPITIRAARQVGKILKYQEGENTTKLSQTEVCVKTAASPGNMSFDGCIISVMSAAEERLRNLPPGSRVEAGRDFGVDLTPLHRGAA